LLKLTPRRWRRILWLTACAAACSALAGCARPGPVSYGTPVFSVDMTGGARQCVASHPQLISGTTVEATMRVGNDGGWCGISVQLDGQPYAAGLLTESPAHGKVFIHPVGDSTRIDYTPEAGFTGTDRFVVQLIPGNAAIRATVTVTR
jgi:Bacterial Ig domain